MADVTATSKKIIANIEKVVIGKRQEIILALAAYFSEGHILLEDVPGVAKTMLARALASSVGATFKRVQCTPDLLPTDITGTSIFNQKTTQFEFRPGPIFSQIVLADEINRATPRTQAALLEAMGERKVSVDGTTFELTPPFLVIATQNPVDHEGTFPLPEAQLDRFLVRLNLGYPNSEEEASMLARHQLKHPIDDIQTVVTANEIIRCQQQVRTIRVDDKLSRYIVELVGRTRVHNDILLGGSPRASLALYRASQALAAIRGHEFITPDDIKRLAPAILCHRIILKPESRLRKVTTRALVDELLDTIPRPDEQFEGDGLMPWFLAIVIVLVIAVVFDLGLLACAMTALLGLMLISRFLARSWITNLKATRECNRTDAEVGQTIAFTVTVKNRGQLPVAWVLIEDMLPRGAISSRPPRIVVKGHRLAVAMLGSRGRKSLNYQLHFVRRGYYQVGPLVLETGDLFGLHRRFRIVTEPVYIMVYPKVVPLPGYDIASRRPIGEIRLTHRLFEDPTRIAGVRYYQPGDPLNRVNWAATARTGVLHSKIYDASTIAGATIVLDFHQGSYPARNEPARSELAVTTALALANAVCLMGQPIGLVTNGRDAADRIRLRDEIAREHAGPQMNRSAIHQLAATRKRDDRLRPIIVPPGRGAESFSSIREVLARVELTDGLTFDRLLIEAEPRLPRDATVVAILGNVTPEMALSLGHLKRQGFAVNVVLLAFDEVERIDNAGPLLAQGLPVRSLSDEDELYGFCELQLVTPL